MATVLAAICAACTPTTTVSVGPIAPVSVDCGLQAPPPEGVDGVLAEIPGFTVTEICPADIDPAFASHEFNRLAAALVSQNGNPILRVLAGQVKNGSAEAFLHDYVANLSTLTREGVGVASEPEQIGGHAVMHLNIPLVTDGYTYVEGPTVVVAYVAAGSPPATVEAALTEILDNV